MSVHRRIAAVSVIAAVAAMAVLAPGVAQARGGSKPATGSTVAVVLLDSTDGVAHYGQRVTFSVNTDVAKPMVAVDCYQAGVHVYWASAGFYEGYPWPWTRDFTLASSYWTSGAADCTATLYTNGRNGRMVTLATTGFPVAA